MADIQNMFILDTDKTTVGVLSNRMPFSLPFYDDLQERSLDDFTNTLTFSIPANHKEAINVTTDKYILYPDIYGGYKLYKVMEVGETSSSSNGYIKEVYCEISTQDDLLKGRMVKPKTFNNASLEDVLEYILKGSTVKVGSVYDFPTQDYKIEDYSTKLEALVKAVQTYGGEMDYSYDVRGTEVYAQYVDVFDRIGKETGKPFIYGKDITGVERKEDATKLVTALEVVGKEDDKGVPMSFKGEKITPIPKGYEIGDDWIGSVKAQEAYSSTGEHIYGLYKDDNARSPQELFDNALKALQDAERPLVTYKVDVVLLERLAGYEHERAELGDTVMVQDKTVQPELYLTARIRKLSRSLTNPTKDAVELGDYIPITPPVNQRLASLQGKIVESEKVWNKASEIPVIQEKLQQVPTKDELFSLPSNRLKVRYIRDYINGSDVNEVNHWVELQVYKKGENIAKGIVPTGSTTFENANYLTDGIIDSSRHVRQDKGLQYVQLDLGESVADIEYLQVWHYFDDRRTYNNHYIDISEDGILWVRIHNSDNGGTSVETEAGIIIPVNSSAILESQNKVVNEVVKDVSNLEDFKVSAEAQIAKKVDAVAYNKKVQELSQEVSEKAGLEYVNGQLQTKTDADQFDELASKVAKKAEVSYVDGKLSGKADTADVEALTAEVADKAGLDYVDGKLVDKANKSDTYTKTEVDKAVNSRVSTTTYTTDKNGIVSRLDAHDTAISQTEKEIALKASQATVDEIDGRLETAEASLTVQAGEIATKVSQTEVDEGVSEAKSHADSKASSALTDSKKYADGKASTAEANAKGYTDAQLSPIVKRVSSAETAITQTKESINLKADKSTVETLAETVDSKADASDVSAIGSRVSKAEGQLTVQADAIAQRVSKTDYTTDRNGIIKRLDTAEASITTQAGQIQLKAEQSAVDAIEGRVEDAEATLTVQAGQISSKVTQTEVDKGVSTAKTYADGKASTALTDAKKYADGAIAPVASRMSKAETDITQTQKDIALRATKTEVDTVRTDVSSAVKRISNAEAELKVNADAITTKVTRDEAKEIAKDVAETENTINMRYIRFIGDGSSSGASSQIVEIGAYNSSDVNIAKGKAVTAGNEDATNLSYITDGTISADKFAELGANLEAQWAMIDLGQVYTDISTVKVWMSWAEANEVFGYSLQVSEDSINWVSLYDSSRDGTYTPTDAGFEISANQQKAIYSFSSELRQTADAISLKADAETVDDINSRLESAEQVISPEAIVSTVTSAVEFTDLLADKADARDLETKADSETVDAIKTDLENTYAKKTDVTVTAEDVDVLFRSASGANLVKNSVGFASTDFWAVTGSVDTEQNLELEQRGAGSGFYFNGGTIKQTVQVRGGKYTVSAIVKKDATGTGYIRATYDNSSVKQIDFVEGTAIDYEVLNFVIDVEGTEIDLEINGSANSGLIITSLQINVGSLPLQWSHSAGEVYTTNIQLNENGIKVMNSNYDGYTNISSEEFSGYYRGDSGEYEEVFSLNKDTTIVNKLDAKQEINMSPMKIVPIKADTLNGWAFVANDE